MIPGAAGAAVLGSGAAVWLPSSISGLVLGLDNQLITEAAGKVTAWPDTWGPGNAATQASPALHPLYEATGWNGTQPCVRFTAASGHVLEANAIAAGFSGDDTPYTINWVLQRTLGTETGERYILGPGQAVSSFPAIRIGQAGNSARTFMCRDNTATPEVACSGAGSSNLVTTREQWTAHFDGTTRSLYLNGALVASSTTGIGTFTLDRFYIGKWRTINGYDFRTPGGQVYSRALSAPELALLWQFNRDRYTGLP